MKSLRFVFYIALWLVSQFLLPRAMAQQLEWIRQWGTASYDYSLGVSAALGNVYISGSTGGSLDGSNAGASDAFLRKYNAAGNLQWTSQLGTSGGDESHGVSADALGNVYISGYTEGNLSGPSAGLRDAFLSRYDALGNLQWTRQFGTALHDDSSGVSADSFGNVYISGSIGGNLNGPSPSLFDAFLRKYDVAGNLQWTRQFGTADVDFGQAVSSDSLGNVYISGTTNGSLSGSNAGSYDAFVRKYDAEGNVQWTQQFGTTSDDSGYSVSADSLGNVYVSGYTYGSLGGPNAGSYDAFVRKYDSSGSLQWTRQFGTVSGDDGLGVSTDSLGNVYVSGNTHGSLGGPNVGDSDTFLSKYDASGSLQWTRQLGTASDDEGRGVSADSLGNVYISGFTNGSLDGPNAGFNDAFVAKYSLVPEPSALLLGAMASVRLYWWRRKT